MGELQEGIYWDKGATPPRCFAIAFFKADRDATAPLVGGLIARLAQLWDGLKAERVSDLPGAAIPRSNFQWLLGFGKKAFELPGAARRLPRNLKLMFNSVDPAGGGSVLDGSGLSYADGVALNPATEELCAQFTGDTPLSVNRAVVETWKLLEGARDPATGKAGLMLSAAFTGFNREDQRSWLGFHDGVSNFISGAERKSVIAIEARGLPPADKWTVNGTYMAFMRLAVDLQVWEKLSLEEQELAVGRTKLSGCPLMGRHVGGQAQTLDGCPAAGTTEVSQPGNDLFREPLDGVDDVVRGSHVQRANHHIVAQRVFRQGYEFLEPPLPGRPLSAGLNFVSFQQNPERLSFILKADTWLGGTNFGGRPDPKLLSVIAAAVFLCPPREVGEPFPGASIFATVVAAGAPATRRVAAAAPRRAKRKENA